MDVKTIRARLGMTAQEFATAIGVSIFTVYRWEAGKYNPDKRAALAIKRLMAKNHITVK